MHYVYILKSLEHDALYIGSTNDVSRRLLEHNNSKSKSTLRYRPWLLIYTEGYFSKEDAYEREKQLKYFGNAYTQLKRRIKNSLRGAH